MDLLGGPVYFIFFVVAALYSTQGFGGGSSYLAALVLLGYSHRDIPPIALLCNLVVTGCAFYRFFGAGYFNVRKILPFVLLSIPASYLGGCIPLSREVFSVLLGGALLITGFRMLMPVETVRWNEVSAAQRWQVGVPVGGILGFFSGLLGIGGGIFLSPFLLLTRWADTKECAAAASFFIFVNSAAGLAARLPHADLRWDWVISLTLVTAAGGLFGSWLGAVHAPRSVMQRVLALLVLMASLKLFEGVL